MGNYHFVYKDVEGASTQWDDIQRKLGNLPPKPPAFKPPSFKPAEDEDSKHKDKARHRDCDYHRRLRLLMCINPIHNNKGLFHQSDNANSEDRWAASSCAMDSIYDLELISYTVPVVFDNSETWHLALSTSLKLGSRGMAHVQKITRVDLKEKSQYSNILLINRTASPLAWVYGVQRSKKPHCYNVAIFISSFNGCPETTTCSRKGLPCTIFLSYDYLLSSAIRRLEMTKFLYGCAVNSYILNVNWLIDSVAAGYALPRDKSLKAWILAHKPPCWTNEKVEYEMNMIELAVKSLRSLRALMPAKERHER
ncbi:unnamed protein product [Camellia sinensis]